ncbi:MAG: hypothetical protein ACYCQJ_14220 [Nitrososphaerales archaeon]
MLNGVSIFTLIVLVITAVIIISNAVFLGKLYRLGNSQPVAGVNQKTVYGFYIFDIILAVIIIIAIIVLLWYMITTRDTREEIADYLKAKTTADLEGQVGPSKEDLNKLLATYLIRNK